MIAYPTAAVALLLLSQHATVDASATPQQKLDFMRAMKSSSRSVAKRKLVSRETEQEFKSVLYGTSRQSSALRKKFMEKAVPKPTADVDTTDADVKSSKVGGTSRKLAAAYYHYDANHDGTDDYLSTYGEWENGFGFDPAQYSLSYHRCAAGK